jgi:DNA-binding FadR family transcriptional regulator
MAMVIPKKVRESLMANRFPHRPLKKIRLYEEVADQIKQSIFDGHLKPGDQVPPERELAEMFNVGRPTIREALRTLTVLGLIKGSHGRKGAVVIETDVTQYMETLRGQLSWLIKTDGQTLEDLSEVRKCLELGVSHAAARNASDEDLEKLDEFIENMAKAGDDFEKYIVISTEFHKKIAQLSGNKMFYIIWSMIQDITVKGYSLNHKTLFPQGPGKLLEANKVMVEGIRSRDPEKIDQAMKFHSQAEDVFHPTRT